MLEKIKKEELIRLIITQLSKDLVVLNAAAEHTRDAAINEESKSEDKHDTRSIEAGYLAGAQRKRVVEIKELITYFKCLKTKTFSTTDLVSATALIALETEAKLFNYFLVPQGGGLEVQIESSKMAPIKIFTITPQTPLGETLLGRRKGDLLSLHINNKFKEYEILAIA